MNDSLRLQTSFTRMEDATREDYQVIARHSGQFMAGLPDRIVTHLQLLGGEHWWLCGRSAHPQPANGDARTSRWSR